MSDPIIQSILDTDLYKLTMQQAALFGEYGGLNFRDLSVRYRLINRDPSRKIPTIVRRRLREQINLMRDLRLDANEFDFLGDSCPFLSRAYRDFLRGYRFDPREVQVIEDEDNPDIAYAQGPWYRTILWEVPILALLSELYFEEVNPVIAEDYLGRAQIKARRFTKAMAHVLEFGTRRRRAFHVQDSVLNVLSGMGEYLVGTSNVYMAMLHGLTPKGTMAHEWISVIAAKFGYVMANTIAMNAWVRQYRGSLGIALVDTFTTPAFLRTFDRFQADLFDGVRQDSGDPIEFAKRWILPHYERLGIDAKTKKIVFSDGLDVAAVEQIQKEIAHLTETSYGIGTFLTNDVGVKPLNIVMKAVECDGAPCVKLSDSPGKYTGKPEAIDLCKKTLQV